MGDQDPHLLQDVEHGTRPIGIRREDETVDAVAIEASNGTVAVVNPDLFEPGLVALFAGIPQPDELCRPHIGCDEPADEMDPQTVELITKLAGPAATVFAALTAASVAVGFGISQSRNAKRQVRIANDKLALDLFQRRIEVFTRIRSAVGEITRSGASSSKVEYDLIEAIDGARFLFANEVKTYLDELYRHLIELDYCNKSMSDPNLPPADRATLAQQRTDRFKSITSFYGKIDNLFGPYLLATHTFTEIS
jgi:hypothetical protein